MAKLISPTRTAKDPRHAALSRLAGVTAVSHPAASPQGGPRIVAPGGAVVPLASFGGFSGGGGFSAGNRTSTTRGHIVFPTLDTSKEINTTNRTEVLTKARWLYNNDPTCKRMADGVARMMGWMMFKPRTPDAEWNYLAKQVALDLALSPERFDAAGKFNFFTYQLLLNRLHLRDCDALTLATQGRDGSTQVLCVEAHQIGSHSTLKNGAEPLFFDGVRTNKQGKHLAYSVLEQDATKKAKIYQAGREAHLTCRYERAGQNRGMSAFAPIANSMLDVREIENDMTLAVKTRNLIGFYMAPREGAPGPQLKGAAGLQSGLKQYRREITRNTDDVAGEEEELVSYEDVFHAGQMYAADEYEPKVLESAQPHDNEMAFLKWKVDRGALGFDIAPQLLFDIGALNGNTQRWLAADAQEMLETRRMETNIPFCNWWWFHAIGAEIASGRLREPKVPAHLEGIVGWWSVDWIPPAKKTVDRGREGKLALDERRAMLRTLDEHYAEYQQDWTDEASQWLDEIIAIQTMAKDKGFSESQIQTIVNNLLAPPAGTSVPDSNEPPSAPPKPDANAAGE